MDFGIKELGITLMVGAFTMLGFEAILHYLFNRGLIGFFSGRLGLEANKRTPSLSSDDSAKGQNKPDQTMTITVFILLAFGIGILAEDLSYKYLDNENFSFRTVLAKILPDEVVTDLALPSEDSDIAITLVKSLKQPTPISLAKDLAAARAFEITDHYNTGVGKRVQAWIESTPPCEPQDKPTPNCPSRGEVEESFKSLFYHAKNTVYKHPNHYDELKRMQARLEFTRSIALIAFIYFIIAVITGTSLMIFHSFSRHRRRKRLAELRVRFPATVAILFCVYFVSVWAFERENDAFNRRAFGYFATETLSDKRQRDIEELLERSLGPRPLKANSANESQTH